MDTSFQSAYTYFKQVDKLRTGPKWRYHMFDVKGDQPVEGDDGQEGFMTETLELWYRDPIECIAELLSNPSFNGSVAYYPERVYADKARKTRIYDEMWTADWWWDIQVSIPMHLSM